jgi:hypothetical protein
MINKNLLTALGCYVLVIVVAMSIGARLSALRGLCEKGLDTRGQVLIQSRI